MMFLCEENLKLRPSVHVFILFPATIVMLETVKPRDEKIPSNRILLNILGITDMKEFFRLAVSLVELCESMDLP